MNKDHKTKEIVKGAENGATTAITKGDGKPTADMSRRGFFKTSALLGGSAVVCDMLFDAEKALADAYAKGENPFDDPSSILHTTCLGCHAHCCIKAKIYNGVLMKLEGSPYGPNGKLPHFPYKTPPKEEAIYDGKMCLKGQSGIQLQYDPYRITKVLKRAGKRGENKWKTIGFNQAIQEIADGGLLFKDVLGEENRNVDGLKKIRALSEPHVMEEMGKDVMKLLHTPQGEEKKKAVEDFKVKFSNYEGKNYLDTLIDPEHPDLGPKNNQFVWYGGRVQYGREAFYLRWVEGAFGSFNWVNHCTICGGSHRCGHANYAAQHNPDDGQFRNEPGKVDICYFSADFLHAEFLILFGHLVFEANYGPTHLGQRVSDGLASGRLTLVSVDPRLSKTGSKSHKWIAIKPATDAALIWAMIRWIMESERYDKQFMTNANKAAAIADNETCWSNGTYLVKIEEDGPGDFLRASDLGDVKNENKIYASQEGKPVPLLPGDEINPVDADIFYEGEVNGKDGKIFKVKSAWQLIKEYAFSKTMEEWSSVCGIDTETIIWLSKEFTSHGKKAVADAHRGLATNGWGTMTVFAMNTLNSLIGNIDWKGGFHKGGGSWDFKGTKEHQPYSIFKKHPGHLYPFGLPLSKQCSMRGMGHRDYTYENSTLFNGYPAKRPWYGPARWGIWQEAIQAGASGYPYPIKALWLACWATPAASSGNAQKMIEVLADVNKIPLLFANDIVIGESSMYADYLFPDTSYLEELQTSKWPSSNLPHKANPLRQTVVAPLVDTCKVYGQEMPICIDSVKLALAEKMLLPGYGPNGFGPGQDFTHFDQFYIKSSADIGVGDKPGDDVPDASDEEVEIFKKAHAHLPKSSFDYNRWKQAAGENYWRKVVTIFNRGGRFQDFEKGYDGDKMGAGRLNRLVNVYSEDAARTIFPGTGKRLPGIGEYRSVIDFLGNDLLEADEKAGYPYTFITYKVVGGANFRGAAPYYWIRETLPENFVVMHKEDAEREGLNDGDWVKLTSVSNPEGMWDLKNGRKYPVGGKIKTTFGIRKGVVGVSYHYGHWAYGSTDVSIDGELIKGDPKRGTGINPNAIRRMDPYLKDVPPSDPIGGQESVPTKIKVQLMTEEDLALMQQHNPAALVVKEMPKTYLGGV